MGKYTKFITAIVAAGLAAVATFTTYDITWTAAQVMTVITPFLGAIGVWLLPNTE